MDIYRKELNQIYADQRLDGEELEASAVKEAAAQTEVTARLSAGAAVLTDAATDRCFIFGGNLGKLMGFFAKQGDSRQNILSKREKEILRLIRDGLSSKIIADRLNINISINTVNRHRQNIISKLSVANCVEAVAAAQAMRLI